jgi:glucose/arabinose dehydrogenase
MHRLRWVVAGGVISAAAGLLIHAAGVKIDPRDLQTFADAHTLKPGTFHKITVEELPKPFATKSAANFGRLIPRPEGVMPQAPPGFKVELYATGLNTPRQIRTAPNGDLFIVESYPASGSPFGGPVGANGDIKIFRGNKDGKPEQVSVFAGGLTRPFGINFYPPGPNPQWVYVGNTGSVVRFPYKNGDLKASGPAETLVSDLKPNGNHWTRDIVFSKDGKRMFVAVGSNDNIDAKGDNQMRANILEFTSEGKFVKIYASGIRNPVGLGVNPTTGEVWCSVNERDELGDNLVPDYITSVKEGGFYGWPWFYIGNHPDPRKTGGPPELAGKAIVPDVLVQPHSASLGLTFYEGKQFPKEYEGDLFAAEHGSWNRAVMSGHEVVRVPLDKGKASGVYEDFLTGFVTSEGQAWGRPVGVTVAKDGSMYVTDDGTMSIWHVSYGK